MRAAITLTFAFVLIPWLAAVGGAEEPVPVPTVIHEAFVLPATDQEWRKVKAGATQVVELDVSESHTRIVLKEGQSVRIVPHPDDRWFIRMEGQDQTPVGWRGETAKGPARSKKLQIMVYPEDTPQGKPVTDETKRSLATHYWTDIAELDGFVWSGPGEIVFRGEFGSDYRGAGKGAIRVKIVPLGNAQGAAR